MTGSINGQTIPASHCQRHEQAPTSVVYMSCGTEKEDIFRIFHAWTSFALSIEEHFSGFEGKLYSRLLVMAILKTNKNNQNVFVRNFVIANILQ